MRTIRTYRKWPIAGALTLLMLSLAYPAKMSGSRSTAALVKPMMEKAGPVAKTVTLSRAAVVMAEADSLYEQLELATKGLSRKAFNYAWKGYRNLLDKGRISRTDVLSICDFSQSSRRKRLYVIDLEEGKLLMNTYVSHGRKSGGEYARKFSNRPESNQSSLGFYITRQTYFGQHGLAMKMEGLEKGYNDKAHARNIVMHGSDYVGSKWLKRNKFNGRSLGCPAIPREQASKVINTIKQGSCLFIYHPTKTYIEKSRVLNS